MTTMLEKAARAMALRDGEDPDMGTWDSINNRPHGKVWEVYVPKVRAALLAIREPSADVIGPASSALAREHGKPTTDRTWTSQFTSMSTRKAFTATIDAILNEKPEGGA